MLFQVCILKLLTIFPCREIGTIIRSLGCCPSEGELHDLIAEVSGGEVGGWGLEGVAARLLVGGALCSPLLLVAKNPYLQLGRS